MTNTTTEHAALEAIRAAQLHEHLATMASSAKLCAETAERFFQAGEYANAKRCAVKSLAYSLGICSPVYQQHAR